MILNLITKVSTEPSTRLTDTERDLYKTFLQFRYWVGMKKKSSPLQLFCEETFRLYLDASEYYSLLYLFF